MQEEDVRRNIEDQEANRPIGRETESRRSKEYVEKIIEDEEDETIEGGFNSPRSEEDFENNTEGQGRKEKSDRRKVQSSKIERRRRE